MSSSRAKGLRRNERDMMKNVCWSSCKIIFFFLSDFNETLNFLDRFSKNPQITNFMKISLVGAELFHTDRHNEDNSRFFTILRTRLKGHCVEKMYNFFTLR